MTKRTTRGASIQNLLKTPTKRTWRKPPNGLAGSTASTARAAFSPASTSPQHLSRPQANAVAKKPFSNGSSAISASMTPSNPALSKLLASSSAMIPEVGQRDMRLYFAVDVKDDINRKVEPHVPLPDLVNTAYAILGA